MAVPSPGAASAPDAVPVFDALGDANRRRLLELLAAGEQPVSALVDRLRGEVGISQPAVSQHLKMLLTAGLVTVRAEGTRRLYSLDRSGVERAQAWLTSLADPIGPFAQPLDALATEVARGQRRARGSSARTASSVSASAAGLSSR